MKITLTATNKHWWRWLMLALPLLALDLFTKQLAVSQLSYAEPVELLPVLNMTLLYNYGAAFSFLAGADGWQRWMFSGVALLVSGFILHWLRSVPKSQWWVSLALVLILAGALGNLWDRVSLGYVVDFISFHYAGYYFPAFNIADTTITIGSALLIVDMLWCQKNPNSPST